MLDLLGFARTSGECLQLDIEFEFDDIAVLYDVSLTFGAEEAGLFDGELGTEAGKIIVFADARGNEATLKIGVDGTGGFGGGGTFLDGPGATFFFAGSEEGLEA